MASSRRFKASPLVKTIFDQNSEMRATVEAQTIVDSDRPYYEPVLLGIRSVKTYNEFQGPKVETWLRALLMSGKQQGPIIAFRFGREYSPVLYLTVAQALPDRADYRKLTARERREIAQDIANQAKDELQADSAKVVAPGVVRLWWD